MKNGKQLTQLYRARIDADWSISKSIVKIDAFWINYDKKPKWFLLSLLKKKTIKIQLQSHLTQ